MFFQKNEPDAFKDLKVAVIDIFRGLTVEMVKNEAEKMESLNKINAAITKNPNVRNFLKHNL